MMSDIERNLLVSMKTHILYDSSLAIDKSIQEVITLFLGSLRAVMISIVTIPLSLIGATVIMQMFGFKFNLMTLLAAVLAIGLAVENVDRHIKLGETPFRATIISTREIAVSVISMAITLAEVYAPIALVVSITL